MRIIKKGDWKPKKKKKKRKKEREREREKKRKSKEEKKNLCLSLFGDGLLDLIGTRSRLLSGTNKRRKTITS